MKLSLIASALSALVGSLIVRLFMQRGWSGAKVQRARRVFIKEV
jgi:hypothetical protein